MNTIPTVTENSPTAINTSIIAIKRAIEEIALKIEILEKEIRSINENQ